MLNCRMYHIILQKKKIENIKMEYINTGCETTLVQDVLNGHPKKKRTVT